MKSGYSYARITLARLLAAVLMGFCTTGVLRAGEAPPIQTDHLDNSINETLKKRDFNWRMPRESLPEEDDVRPNGIVHHLLEDISTSLEKGFDKMIEWLKRVDRWLDRMLRDRNEPYKEPIDYDLTWQDGVRMLMFLLLATSLCVLAILLYRRIRYGRIIQTTIPAVAQVQVDIEDPELPADSLPSNEWLIMAERFLAEGNGRLATRAYFLAGLSHLAAQNRLSLARSKSNRDYTVELIRRDHDQPAIIHAFREQIGTLERVWYGMHLTSPEQLDQARSHCMTLLSYRMPTPPRGELT